MERFYCYLMGGGGGDVHLLFDRKVILWTVTRFVCSCLSLLCAPCSTHGSVSQLSSRVNVLSICPWSRSKTIETNLDMDLCEENLSECQWMSCQSALIHDLFLLQLWLWVTSGSLPANDCGEEGVLRERRQERAPVTTYIRQSAAFHRTVCLLVQM